MLSAYTRKATFIRSYGVILEPRQDIVEWTGQGYHQINWDNPGYPELVTFGPERGPEEVLRRWAQRVWNVPSSVTKTCVYHDITSCFGISKIINKYEALYKSVQTYLSWDILGKVTCRVIPGYSIYFCLIWSYPVIS